MLSQCASIHRSLFSCEILLLKSGKTNVVPRLVVSAHQRHCSKSFVQTGGNPRIIFHCTGILQVIRSGLRLTYLHRVAVVTTQASVNTHTAVSFPTQKHEKREIHHLVLQTTALSSNLSGHEPRTKGCIV